MGRPCEIMLLLFNFFTYYSFEIMPIKSPSYKEQCMQVIVGDCTVTSES